MFPLLLLNVYFFISKKFIFLIYCVSVNYFYFVKLKGAVLEREACVSAVGSSVDASSLTLSALYLCWYKCSLKYCSHNTVNWSLLRKGSWWGAEGWWPLTFKITAYILPRGVLCSPRRECVYRYGESVFSLLTDQKVL